MKTPVILCLAALLFFSCNNTVSKNKKTIDAVVASRAVAKSVKVDSYNITKNEETSDSLILYIDVKAARGESYSDTLRFAKTQEGLINPY